jgi:hypothetical protein
MYTDTPLVLVDFVMGGQEADGDMCPWVRRWGTTGKRL